ncbi:uncharacterized protein LOC120793514 [Xiphias gladius]|uniref:uncharacterized protein LOC120793514 n=1 Tax=Xiphias gladius TaxID=8245 RepID=UPI001A990E30|nr:uncharacterized protein LOC120793514 [Xiphias gladius]
MWQPLSAGYWFSGIGVNSDMGCSSPLPSLSNPDKTTEIPAPQDTISSTGPGSYSSSTNMAENEFDNDYTSFRDGRYSSPEVNEYGVVYAASHTSGYDSSAPSVSYSGGYGSSSSRYVGSSSEGFVTSPHEEDWSSGSATNYGVDDETPEAIISDLSDLEPVYSFSSRSSYQRGRTVFAQTQYTPGEPVPLVMPVSRHISKTSKQSSSAEAPAKGGF